MKNPLLPALAAVIAIGALLSACTLPTRQEPQPPMRSGHVVVLATGGTIASTHVDGAVIPTVSGPELVDAIRDRIGEKVKVEVQQVAELDSSAMTFKDTDTILTAIGKALDRKDVDAVVVTHGTDSMEESAVAADAFLSDTRPVVFTGAMRAFDDEDPDGPANLSDAINASLDPANRGKGAFISFGGRLIPARGAYKATPPKPMALPPTSRPTQPARMRCPTHRWHPSMCRSSPRSRGHRARLSTPRSAAARAA